MLPKKLTDTAHTEDSDEKVDPIRAVATPMKYLYPDLFDGRPGQDPIDWMNLFERIADVNAWNHMKKNQYFSLCMRGRATKWFQSRCHEDLHAADVGNTEEEVPRILRRE